MPITPEQLDRGLSIAENVVGLAADIWQHRKTKRKPRIAVTRKASTKKRLAAKNAGK